MQSKGFLPVTRDEMRERGIEEFDFIYVSGDAYVDHPSFGPAIICRLLERHGYSVGIIAQPDWHGTNDFMRFGRPRLAFLVSAGNMDSMVNHYTAAKKRRSTDSYSEGGKAGRRPDRAVIVYCNRIREAYGSVPIVIGGIEASLRRFAHYDYWDNKVRASILFDSGADLISYGMGEHSIIEIAEALSSGLDIRDITFIAGTCYKASSLESIYDYVLLPSFEEVAKDKRAYAGCFMRQYEEQDPIRGKRLVQPHGKSYLAANPPALPLTQQEMDDVYELPFMRAAHPSYREHIPAIDEVEFSLTSCRGCYGACSFCALTFHQGRIIQSRSHASLIREAKLLTKQKNFKGYIHDVGGPTANFRKPACEKQLKAGACKDRQCLGYERCKNVEVNHTDFIALLRKLREIPGVKKVFVRSGIRYDYVMYDKSSAFLRELIEHHVSGHLKVAPEHADDHVLRLMGKPCMDLYKQFSQKFETLSRKVGKEEYLVPYFISSHPGCDMDAAIRLAEFIAESGQHPQQVQDFYPTPGTVSTCMYYTGLDPYTMKEVYVARDPHEKALQRALLQYYDRSKEGQVREALLKAGRRDLIGYGEKCLVRPAGPGSAPAKRGRNISGNRNGNKKKNYSK